MNLHINGELPEGLNALEEFVSHIYSATGQTTLLQLRWELFRSKNRGVEILPSTRAALLPHIILSKLHLYAR